MTIAFKNTHINTKMKKYKYLIQFKHNSREVYGFGLKEALIHALHEQYGSALDTEILWAENMEKGNRYEWPSLEVQVEGIKNENKITA